MAVFFTQGTLNPASTTLSNDLRVAFVGAIQAAITAGITGWSIQDDAYVNGSSKRTVINNTAGYSLMLLNSTTITDTTLDFYLGQSYTLATHTLNNVGFGLSGSTTLSNATGFSGTTYNPTAVSTSNFGTPAIHTSGYFFTATGTQSNWAAHINNTYAIFSFKDGSTNNGQWLYFGAYTSLVTSLTITDTYPFVMVKSTTAGNNTGGVFLNSLDNFNKTIVHGAYASGLIQNAAPAKAGTYNKYIEINKAAMSEILITRGYSNYVYSDSNVNGWKRGKLTKCFNGNGISAVWGDTVNIDGIAYFYMGGLNESVANTSLALWAAVS